MKHGRITRAGAHQAAELHKLGVGIERGEPRAGGEIRESLSIPRGTWRAGQQYEPVQLLLSRGIERSLEVLWTGYLKRYEVDVQLLGVRSLNWATGRDRSHHGSRSHHLALRYGRVAASRAETGRSRAEGRNYQQSQCELLDRVIAPRPEWPRAGGASVAHRRDPHPHLAREPGSHPQPNGRCAQHGNPAHDCSPAERRNGGCPLY
jgi:hypothetical protein